MTIRFKPVIDAGGTTLNRESPKPSLRAKLALGAGGLLAVLGALLAVGL